MTDPREEFAQAIERGDDLEAEVARRRADEQLNQNEGDFRPLGEINPLADGWCERCGEAECVCRWLPYGWWPGAHPSYLECARRQRDKAK